MLVDYINDVLSQAEKEAVENHLSQCTTCTQELDDIQATLQLFAPKKKEIVAVRPSERFLSETLANVKKQLSLPLRRRSKVSIQKLAYYFALIAIGFLMGYGCSLFIKDTDAPIRNIKMRWISSSPAKGKAHYGISSLDGAANDEVFMEQLRKLNPEVELKLLYSVSFPIALDKKAPVVIKSSERGFMKLVYIGRDDKHIPGYDLFLWINKLTVPMRLPNGGGIGEFDYYIPRWQLKLGETRCYGMHGSGNDGLLEVVTYHTIPEEENDAEKR
jgi:hypothetical protein